MAKNRKYIIGSGIAISPEKDMALFKKMSKQGWHMSGIMLCWYCFEKGEPADYDYASNMESKVTKDMLSIYEESGWTPVVACNGFQIFRAKAGATPIFSDRASEIEALEKFEGVYAFELSGTWSLRLVDGKLIAVDDEMIIELVPMSDGTFESMLGRFSFETVGDNVSATLVLLDFISQTGRVLNPVDFPATQDFADWVGIYHFMPQIASEVALMPQIRLYMNDMDMAMMDGVALTYVDGNWYRGLTPLRLSISEDGVYSIDFMGGQFVRL